MCKNKVVRLFFNCFSSSPAWLDYLVMRAYNGCLCNFAVIKGSWSILLHVKVMPSLGIHSNAIDEIACPPVRKFSNFTSPRGQWINWFSNNPDWLYCVELLRWYIASNLSHCSQEIIFEAMVENYIDTHIWCYRRVIGCSNPSTHFKTYQELATLPPRKLFMYDLACDQWYRFVNRPMTKYIILYT